MKQETRLRILKERFVNKMGYEPTDYFTSPGRIELLGNHTDHNNGKVLVSSIDLNILAATAKRDDNKVVFYSKGYKKMEVSLKRLKLKDSEKGSSIAVIRGVLYRMKELGYNIGGFTCVMDSSVPKGAGVSSSAAFELIVAEIVSYYFNNDSIPPFELAKIAQYAETVYFNKPCGLLDQSGIALGGINYIDFKSTTNPEIKNLKLRIKGYQFIIINTGDDHSKLTHCYAEIKDDMKMLSDYFGKSVLREVDEVEFYAKKEDIISRLGLRVYLRGKHYFEENERVKEAYEGLSKGNQKKLLEMMDASGISSYHQLKNCYVSSEEENLPKALNRVKEIDPTCYSRVHGGGFAGTMLMIVSKNKLKDILPILQEEFGKKNVMKVNLVENGTTRL